MKKVVIGLMIFLVWLPANQLMIKNYNETHIANIEICNISFISFSRNSIHADKGVLIVVDIYKNQLQVNNVTIKELNIYNELLNTKDCSLQIPSITREN